VLNLDDPVWEPAMFTENRQWLLAGEVVLGFLDHVVE
jgi:hypothetical protein